MNYELAKQLKDAGFPQNESDGKLTCYYRGTSDHGCDENCLKLSITHPTLSELIEACKPNIYNGFSLMIRENGLGEPEEYNAIWIASFDWEQDYIFGEGETPEEAVARLWLELNKK